ncbi:MAG: hypothetical protein IPN69_08035 [Acidobacteria bacterium]|nr:hypothetical protein [Acidobacteriota bacterium]
MSDYLQEIEVEYQRIRGRRGILKPLDWDLADRWERAGIPLGLVLRTIETVGKQFRRTNPNDTINSLRYFESSVESAFAAWRQSRIGAPEPEPETRSEVEAALDRLAGSLDREDLPEPLISAIRNARDIVLALLDSDLSETAIEEQLEPHRAQLDLCIGLSLPTDVSDRLKLAIDREFGARLTVDATRNLLIARAYKHFGLPQLTLFEL